MIAMNKPCAGKKCYTFIELSLMNPLFLIPIFLLLVVTAGYSGVHQLTTDPAMDDQPCWSADDSKIAFASTRTGKWQIWVMNADGTNQHNISISSSNDYTPAYSPDGSQIAFSSDRAGNGDYDIYVMPANGGTATRITFSGYNEQIPTWSPDKTYLAYQAYDPIGYNFTHIWKILATGGTGTQLTFGNCDDMKPAWSPDGTKIAFYAADRFEIGSQLCTMTTNGENITEIINAAYDPCWSPDSTEIAYTWGDVYRIPATGGTPQRVTYFGTDCFYPSWSHDGTKIAFRHYNSPTSYDIWYVDLNDEKVEPTSLGRIKTLYK
jgi:Tol biopolymer transport system component